MLQLTPCYNLPQSPLIAQLVFLFPIQTTMNGVKCHKMLEDKLKIHMTIYECNTFMQDSAPCHHSKLVSDSLRKISKRWIG